MKIPVLSVWPGSDGADYHFQIDYRQSLEWFTEALVAVNKECLKAGIKLAVEPKPYEPRELYMIIPTAASAILVAQRVNETCGRDQLRPHGGLRPPEDGGHHRLHGVRSRRVCRRPDPQVRHQRRAPGAERPGPHVRDDLDPGGGGVPVHHLRARLPRLLQPGPVHLPRRPHAGDGAEHGELRQPRAEGGAGLREAGRADGGARGGHGPRRARRREPHPPRLGHDDAGLRRRRGLRHELGARRRRGLRRRPRPGHRGLGLSLGRARSPARRARPPPRAAASRRLPRGAAGVGARRARRGRARARLLPRAGRRHRHRTPPARRRSRWTRRAARSRWTRGGATTPRPRRGCGRTTRRPTRRRRSPTTARQHAPRIPRADRRHVLLRVVLVEDLALPEGGAGGVRRGGELGGAGRLRARGPRGRDRSARRPRCVCAAGTRRCTPTPGAACPTRRSWRGSTRSSPRCATGSTTQAYPADRPAGALCAAWAEALGLRGGHPDRDGRLRRALRRRRRGHHGRARSSRSSAPPPATAPSRPRPSDRRRHPRHLRHRRRLGHAGLLRHRGRAVGGRRPAPAGGSSDVCEGDEALHARSPPRRRASRPGSPACSRSTGTTATARSSWIRGSPACSSGQTLHTTRAEVYRALIEATAFGARAIIERLTRVRRPDRARGLLRRHRGEERPLHADLRRRARPADAHRGLAADAGARRGHRRRRSPPEDGGRLRRLRGGAGADDVAAGEALRAGSRGARASTTSCTASTGSCTTRSAAWRARGADIADADEAAARASASGRAWSRTHLMAPAGWSSCAKQVCRANLELVAARPGDGDLRQRLGRGPRRRAARDQAERRAVRRSSRPEQMVPVSLETGTVARGHAPPLVRHADAPGAVPRASRAAASRTRTRSTRRRFAQARMPIRCMGTTHADHFRGDVPVTRPMTARRSGGPTTSATPASSSSRPSRRWASRRRKCRRVARGQPRAVHLGRDAFEAVEHARVLEFLARMERDGARSSRPTRRSPRDFPRGQALPAQARQGRLLRTAVSRAPSARRPLGPGRHARGLAANSTGARGTRRWRPTASPSPRRSSSASFGQRNDAILGRVAGRRRDAGRVRRIGEAKEARYRRLVADEGIGAAAGRGEWVRRLHAEGLAPGDRVVGAARQRGGRGARAWASPGTSGRSSRRRTCAPASRPPTSSSRRGARSPCRRTAASSSRTRRPGIEAAQRAGMRSIGAGAAGLRPPTSSVASLADLPPDTFERLVPPE